MEAKSEVQLDFWLEWEMMVLRKDAGEGEKKNESN